MRFKIFMLVALLLATEMFVGAVEGQTRRPKPAAPKTPLETASPVSEPATRKVTVKLKDGRSLDADFIRASADQLEVRIAGNVLKIAMAEVAAIVFSEPTVAVTPQPAAPTTGTLAMEAGIIYKSGGNQPVGRTEFRLLDADLESLISGAGLRADRGIDLVSTWAIKRRYNADATLLQIEEAIKQHTVQSVTTDFNGKAQFDNLPPAKYFVYGITETRRGFAVWSVPVEIKAGQNSVVLDQNNAATAF
ncbi:MAG TPA: prealbumin-like fold domain-containing protein [Pyrinomonadaceae bacterium]|nr:prealbumin-like fold domain-containing protein [Pyrinomonadaceae bacterium]